MVDTRKAEVGVGHMGCAVRLEQKKFRHPMVKRVDILSNKKQSHSHLWSVHQSNE